MSHPSRTPSPDDSALVAFTSLTPNPNPNPPTLPPPDEWHPVFHASNQVVLYNPTSHALSIQNHRVPHPTTCPYCRRPFPQGIPIPGEGEAAEGGEGEGELSNDHALASNYFQLLAISNEVSSAPPTPHVLSAPTNSQSSTDTDFTINPNSNSNPDSNSNSRGPSVDSEEGFRPSAMAQGYFARFFKEECRLGMGANGSVFLCQHLLSTHPLGHFAIKKIAVGHSHSYLLQILREVRLLERLHHPNIVTYHHAWLESARFGFGPEVPTLHILMQWAEGGSLDDYISARLGNPHPHPHPTSRSARIKAFREQKARNAPKTPQRRAEREGREGLKAVHLLSAEEVRMLFGDVVEGLGFLHDKSILHLDLKPGNVLLTYDEGQLIPRAMLSDFGTSRDMLQTTKARSGNTGTLEYSSPESLPSPTTGLLRSLDSKADMWSLGMILHKMLFFRLPYRFAEEGSSGSPGSLGRLESEVAGYPGFTWNKELAGAFESRRLPRAFLYLLEKLLHPSPQQRPSCERVLGAIHEGRLNPVAPDPRQPASASLIPVPRKRRRDIDPGLVFQAELDSEAVPADGERITEEEGEGEAVPDADADGGGSQLAPTKVEEWGTQDDGAVLPVRRLRLGRWAEVWLRTTGVGVGVGDRASVERVRRRVVRRSVKSVILVVKAVTISWTCPPTRPHALVLLVVLALAVVDTWFDEMTVSVVLLVAHFGILRLGCGADRCCV